MTTLPPNKFTVPDVNFVWTNLLRDLLENGVEVRPRDRTTLELLGYQTKIRMNEPLITVRDRNLGYKFAAAEPAWIASGDNRVETIKPFAKHIPAFSDDGDTYFGAYGPKFVDQLSFVVSTLINDPMSRQAVMTFWREKPGRTKDVPCTIALQFIIRGGRLNCISTMRSSDAWFGFPYDVHTFSVLAMQVLLLLRNRLRQLHGPNVEIPYLGELILTAGSQHIYKSDWEIARFILTHHFAGDVEFNYDAVDLDEFPTRTDLINHYWALARKEPTPFKWLREIHNVGPRAEIMNTVQT